jgi:imidazole glycerol-phosphate synthase subunit HisH
VSLTTAPRVAIIDYGIGNLRSAEKAMQKAGADAFLTRNPSEIAAAQGVVLPGVGAMGRCIEALRQSGLQGAALDAVASGRPFLGVCVGMQMLHAGSTEFGGVEGLGVFPGSVVELQPQPEHDRPLKVPHMQWNRLQQVQPSQLLAGMPDELWVYFVHSFAPEPHPYVVATAQYGGPVSAIVERANVMGTQFHPEKSGAHGLSLLGQFVKLCGASLVQQHDAQGCA